MSKFVDILKLVAALMPMAKILLEQAEALYGSGKGAEKIAFVRNALQSAYTAIDTGRALFDSAWPAIKAFIDTTVAAYNALGKFKKG